MMLSSLPPLLPHDAHSLYYPSPSAHQPAPPSQNSQNPNNILSRTPAVNQYHRIDTPIPVRTALSILRADENTVAIRKANIRRFGAGWLRPLGVGKTLQGMADERAEREEQEGVAQRELALADAQAAAEAEAFANGETPEGLDPEDELGHDLDNDVPDAEEGGWVDDDEIDEDDEDNIDEQTLAEMNDEGEGDYAEQPDLDDDVPEAGSYQHTDTEVEDSSSLDEPLGARAGDRRTTFDMTQEAVERSMRLGTGGGGSGVLGSSVFGSSPVLQMSYQGRRASGGGRGRGREN